MQLDFTPVPMATATLQYTEEFLKQFNDSWDFFKQHPDHHLECNFPNARTREAWLKMAKTYGLEWTPQIHVRRIKNTGSSDPKSGYLMFHMELLSDALARHEDLRAKEAEREQRRASGVLVGHR